MFPVELWEIIYHYSDIDSLLKYCVVEKTMCKVLSSKYFWIQYYNFICQSIKFDIPRQWVNEIKYCKMIQTYYDKLEEFTNYNYMFNKNIKRFSINNGTSISIICNLRNTDYHKLDILHHYTINENINVKLYEYINCKAIDVNILILLNFDEVLIHVGYKCIYHRTITPEELYIILYQLIKIIPDNTIKIE